LAAAVSVGRRPRARTVVRVSLNVAGLAVGGVLALADDDAALQGAPSPNLALPMVLFIVEAVNGARSEMIIHVFPLFQPKATRGRGRQRWRKGNL